MKCPSPAAPLTDDIGDQSEPHQQLHPPSPIDGRQHALQRPFTQHPQPGGEDSATSSSARHRKASASPSGSLSLRRLARHRPPQPAAPPAAAGTVARPVPGSDTTHAYMGPSTFLPALPPLQPLLRQSNGTRAAEGKNPTLRWRNMKSLFPTAPAQNISLPPT